MANFKRSIQATGYQSKQVSRENERQLQAHANRIIEGLQAQREADLSNQNRILNSLKENARIESEQAAFNQKIKQQNISNQLAEQQQIATRAQNEYNIRVKETENLFKSISKFSESAAKGLAEHERAKAEKIDKGRAAKILLEGDNNEDVKKFLGVKTAAQIEEVNNNTELALARERGADPLIIDDQQKRLDQLGYHTKAALLMHSAKKYEGYLLQQYQNDEATYDDPSDPSKKFAGSEAAGYLYRAHIVNTASLAEFEKLNGISQWSPELKQASGYYDYVLGVNQRFANTARQRELEDNKQRFAATFNFNSNNLSGKEYTTYLEIKFKPLASRLGFKQALDMVQAKAEEVDLNGEFSIDLEALAAARIGPNGETFADYWPERMIAIKKARVRGYNSVISAQETNREMEATAYYRSSLGAALEQQLAEAPPQQDTDILETAEAELFKKFGTVPQAFKRRQQAVMNQNKVEAEAAAALVREKIRIGTATQGDVLSIADPTLRAQAQTEYIKATKVRKFGENYDVTLKAVKNAAKQIMGDSLEGAASFEAERLNLVMQKNFAADYEKGLTLFGGDTTRALQYASDILEKDKTEALANNNSKARYYSETGPNNQKVFKNVRGLESKTNAQKQAALNTLRDTIGAVGVNALDSPGILGSEMELRKISEANRVGGTLMFTPQIILASQLLNIGPIEAVNTAIAAHNQTAAVPITPLTLDPVNRAIDTARPETVKLFTVNPTLNRVQRGAAEIAGTPLRDPSNMRFNIRQYVTGDPTMQGVVRGADSRAVIYDPVGHGGQHEHGHYELSSVAERVRMEEFLRNTIDPFTGQPYRITSVIREGDPGAHGAGTAIDVAPPLNLPVGQEPAWYAELNKRLGYNPLNAD